MGKVYTSASSTGGTGTTPCTRNNYSDASQCHPAFTQPVTCTKDGCPRSDMGLAVGRQREKNVPPALPAINANLGLRYDFFRHLSMKFDTGLFLPGFWFFQLALTGFF
jgi:hypothetical protein